MSSGRLVKYFTKDGISRRAGELKLFAVDVDFYQLIVVRPS